MDINTFRRNGGFSLSYEKLFPIAVAFCAIMMAIWVPICISNAYIIHSAETKNILSGNAAKMRAQNNHAELIALENKVRELEKIEQKGPSGPQGDTGEKGIKGSKGITGNKGPNGYGGRTGPRGPPGNHGVNGQKGDLGEQGPSGNATGDPGPKGSKGENGSKGDGPYTAPNPIVFNITGGEGDKTAFQVFCDRACRDVSIELAVGDGEDANLYASQGSPPRILSDGDCPDCICNSTSTSQYDLCVVSTRGGDDTFYAMVYGYTGYSGGSNITFDGPNLLNVTLDADDSLIHTTTTPTLTTAVTPETPEK